MYELRCAYVCLGYVVQLSSAKFSLDGRCVSIAKKPSLRSMMFGLPSHYCGPSTSFIVSDTIFKLTEPLPEVSLNLDVLCRISFGLLRCIRCLDFRQQ